MECPQWLSANLSMMPSARNAERAARFFSGPTANMLCRPCAYANRRRSRDVSAVTEADLLRFWAKVNRSDPCGCWQWLGATDTKCYAKVGRAGRTWKATRWLLSALQGSEIPRGQSVLHSCDNPLCVNPAHLSLGDQKQNMSEAKERGRLVRSPETVAKTSGENSHWKRDGGEARARLSKRNRGEGNAGAKLTEEKVREIRARAEAGENGQALANEFGISRALVTKVKQRKLWAHV